MPKPTPPSPLTPLPQHNDNNTWLTVGQIGRAYGLKGWVKIHSYTDPCTNLMHYQPWHRQTPEGFQPLPLTDCQPHGHALIAHFAGIDTPEATRSLVNVKISILRSQLPPLAINDYYWTDLEGLNVYNLQQHYFGQVKYLFETGANDVMVVSQKNHAELFIPFVMPHIVKQVNIAEKKIIVDWEIIL